MPEKAKQPEELAMQLEKMENISNNMNTAVYVSDLATNEILYANMALRQFLNDYSLIGKVCWEAMKNTSQRCSYCRIPHLLKNPGKGCHWEMCLKGRRYQMYDNIIPWVNGRLAHMRCMVEMAECKEEMKTG